MLQVRRPAGEAHSRIRVRQRARSPVCWIDLEGRRREPVGIRWKADIPERPVLLMPGIHFGLPRDHLFLIALDSLDQLLCRLSLVVDALALILVALLMVDMMRMFGSFIHESLRNLIHDQAYSPPE